MEINYKDLKSLFINDTSLAIVYCQVVIATTSNFETFNDFYNYHLNHSQISTCPNEWTKRQMSIHCDTCGTTSNSCICLQCFLNGDHQGHDVTISPYSLGNCDCGDLSQWKRSGFCSIHHGLEDDSHPEDYLDEKLRILLTDIIFKSAFTAIKHLPPNDNDTLSSILQFLISFLKFGDGFRRLISIALTEKINLLKFFKAIFDKNFDFNQQLEHFFGNLVNDQLFKVNFAPVNIELMTSEVVPILINTLKGEYDSRARGLLPWGSFWFHSYSKQTIEFQIKKRHWDWVTFSIKTLNYMKELFLVKIGGIFSDIQLISDIFSNLTYFEDAAKIQPNEETQNFFDLFFNDVVANGTTEGMKRNVNDTIIVSSFNPADMKLINFGFINFFDLVFFVQIEFFKSKKNLKFDTMFEKLDKSFDISQIYLIGKNVVGQVKDNTNDEFVSYLLKPKQNSEQLKIIDYHYKSFPNGASFFVTHLMYYSLVYMLRNDNLCRIKIARFLSTKQYQSLRIRLGIAALKNIIAMISSYQNLVPKENELLLNYVLLRVKEQSRVSMGIPLFLPLLQLLIGIRCDDQYFGMNEFSLKEFFAFEMAREIGLFDDHIDNSRNDFDEIRKQMIFIFLYFSLLLVIDRTLFNFDGYKFNKEQIIFELKRGVSNLNDLNYKYDTRPCDDDYLNKIISEVATVRQKTRKSGNFNSSGDQDVSFDLKEGIEINIITAINSINDAKVFMNNEISKHPNELLKIQQFEPEESYFFHQNNNNENEEEEDLSDLNVCLKEFLITPTVLAFVYKTLRKDFESANKADINEHLAMNILVLISKFIQESDFANEKETFNDESTVIKYDSTVSDLISQLKKVVFKHKLYMNRNATITNTLSVRGFNSFLNMKICSSNEIPKSLFDVLIEKGEIGKKVLSQMSVNIVGDDDNEVKQDVNKMKKIRAQKLKEDIQNHYKSVIEHFNVNGDNDLDDHSNQSGKEVCSICSVNKKNEILSYPLYIYRTKFPFIIDKPPLVKMTKRTSLKEADVSQDEEILQSLDFSDIEDEEERVPDLDELIAQALNTQPDLDITSDLDEREIQRRRILVDVINEGAKNKHKNLLQQREERINNRIQQRKLEFQQKKDELIRKESELDEPESIITKRCTSGNLFVIQFCICQHLVHHECVNEENFSCPIDRSYKNGLLPNIDDLSEEVIYADINDKNPEKLSDEMKEALAFFINKYSLFFKSSDDKIVDLFVELVKSISGLIATFEVRLRSLPDCLDSKKTKFLSRNLFLATWYAYRMKGKPVMKTGFKANVSEDVESKLTVFQRFIKKLIECDELEESVSAKNLALQRILSSFIANSSSLFNNEDSKRGEKELCLFLRRVSLADHFLLKSDEKKSHNDEAKLTDWDEILSSENLSQKFGVSFNSIDISNGEEFEFKPFVFSKLPKEFLRFAQEPYNFPVEQTTCQAFFSILNYNRMIVHYDDLSENEDSDNASVDYFNQLTVADADDDKVKSLLLRNFSKKNYPSVVLYICNNASNIAVIDGKSVKLLRPFYLDKFGCTDVGYARNQQLFLNEERYERVMDQILSGDFSNGMDMPPI